MLRRLLRRENRRGRVWLIVVAAVVIVAALVVGWQVYERAQDTEIREGAVVQGVDIGGLEPEEAAAALEPVEQEVAETTVELEFVELQYQDQSVTLPATEFSAAELGISLDTDRTLAEADSPAPPVARPAAWLFDIFTDRIVNPEIKTDLGALADTVGPYTDPETPRIALVDGSFQPVLVTDLPVPDMELLAERLEEAVQKNVGGRAVVEVPVSGVKAAEPAAASLAAALAVEANEITAGGVTVQLEGTSETFAIGELAIRQFIILDGEHHDTSLALDPGISATLASLFVGIGEEGEPATIGLDDTGTVTITAGELGFKCCDDSAPEVLLAQMIDDEPVAVLPPTPAQHPRGHDWAESLGLVEVVGEFTTSFKPGQTRVVNIARIAELTRGTIIEPGQRFSVNDLVGPRTIAKGFVPAGMILRGVFVDSVGGGISQYVTTLFNAAFFAGLDFIDYQSHSIYLSRYPYGREATVSYPRPDLVIENNTPYGVMLWPTTADDSITVKLYSTPWVHAEQTNQWSRTIGTSCTRVTTERTRTYLDDGRSETDTVWAQYRPEGLKCDGSPSVTTTTTTTTTVAPEPGEGGWEQGETETDLGSVEQGETETDLGSVEQGETETDLGSVEPGETETDLGSVEPGETETDLGSVDPDSGVQDGGAPTTTTVAPEPQ